MTTANAKRMQKLREARGLSVADLSGRIGADPRAIQEWESGSQKLDLTKLRPLAEAFGVSQDEIRLEENRRHHVVGGHRFVLETRHRPPTGWTSRVALHDANDTTPPFRDLPDLHIVGGTEVGWSETKPSANESLTALADRITAAIESR